MKKLKYLTWALLVACLLAIPAAAQKHRMGRMGQRNNNGPREPHGQARAEEVESANKKGDKDRKKSKSNNGKKIRTREGWEKKAKHNGSMK